MKIRAVSDLHGEFFKLQSDWEALVDRVCSGDFDVLVVAGDVGAAASFKKDLISIVEAADGKPVVYVAGNHESYGGTIGRTRALLSELTHDNLFVLDNSVAEIAIESGERRRFVGTTLWYPVTQLVAAMGKKFAGDFVHIASHDVSIGIEIDDEAKSAAAFLSENVQRGDVVVTHFMPHPLSIAPRWQGSPGNVFFMHDVSSIVESAGAALWIHGHTHDSIDFRVNDTRVVCNPHGYVDTHMSNEPNPQWDPTLTITI